MDAQNIDEIVSFLKSNIEPIQDPSYGVGYRASAYLVDGTFLPCVIFRNPQNIVDLAIKRFEDERTGKSIFKDSKNSYRKIVQQFVTKGNCINNYCIAKIEVSRYAFPCSVLKKIKGETTMGWTGFAAKMTDNRYFGFGTTFSMEFFQMPKNYTVYDIEEIINHSYVLKNGDLRSHEDPFFALPDDYSDAIIYRERPFFECYIDTL